ncbi:uncharacterized protein LOC126974992 [Leptidea sinapis]|uniref:uncharacterized protein LOC126974992 n=1 Tax=Leptidea sinapis TaxID=189913 RepID=UPI00212CBA0C|nr:uncharacterized protein LOC126974992 [Leptidea sinapis]
MRPVLDIDQILSENKEWRKLEEEWGIPVDLEADNDDDTPQLKPVVSTLDLKTTFDSSFLFKKVRRHVGRQVSKISNLEYKDFINDLQHGSSKESSQQFYIVNGQIISATSVDEICKKIDEVFKTIERFAMAKANNLPETIACSISTSDLSFDDTNRGDEVNDTDEMERHMEEAFQDLNSTLNNMELEGVDRSTLDSVTTLVRKYSDVLSRPAVKCSPRRERQCSEKFKDLAEFWKSRAFHTRGGQDASRLSNI